MPQYDAGTAAIKIKPSFKDFVKDAEAELKTMNFSVDVRLGIDTTDATAEMERFRAAAGRQVDVRIGVDTSAGATEVESFRRAAGENVSIRVDADTRVAAGELEGFRRSANDGVTVRVDADTRVAAAEMAAFRASQREGISIRANLDGNSANVARRGISSLTGDLAKAATLNLKVLGVVGAAGAVSDLLAIAQAASKVANTVALIPAIGFAGLAGIGSVAAGFSGIPAAFKAMSAASKDSAADAGKQRDALTAVGDAEYRMEQSNRTLAESQRGVSDAYKDASRAVRDMNNNLTDQKLATEDAALSVQEAAQRLQQVQFDPAANSTQRARAKLTYDEAVQRLTEQQTKTQDLKADTADANAKGVEGSDQVTTAKQKVVEATHAQTDAQQALTKAQEDAAKGSASQSTLDQALAKLSPNARQLVDDIRALGPAWTSARSAAQDALTNGMGPAVTRLADVQLPALRDGMVGIDGAINGGLRASISALSSDVNRVDFKRSLDNTVTGFANAAKGSEGWTNALTKLVTVGSTFLPQMGTALANVGDRFNDLIQRTSADGSLRKWIQEGVDAGRTLFSIIGNIGSSIASVFHAAGDDGATLKKLDDLTDRLKTFLKSADGQERLKEFFNSARESFDKMKPILADLPGILKSVFNGFQTWSNIAMPFLRAAADLLQAHPGLVRDVVVAYLAFKTVGPVLSLVSVGISGAITQMGLLRNSVGFTSGAMQLGFRTAMGSVASFLTGPFGIALAAAAVGLLLLKNRHDEAARAAQEQKQHEENLQATLDKGTGKVTKQTLETSGQELQSQGFFTRAKSFGVDPQTFLRASLGLADADKTSINEQLTGTITGSLNRLPTFAKIDRQRYASAGLSDTDVAQALQGVPEAVKKYTDATKAFNDSLGSGKQDQRISDLHALKERLDDVGESAATLGGKMNGYATETGSAGEKQRELNAGINGSFQLTDGAKQRFTDLGIAVQSVPDSKSVAIRDTTPENIKHLEDLGYAVSHLEDGTVVITADDARARADIAAITSAPYQANVQVKWDFDNLDLKSEAVTALNSDISNTEKRWTRADGGIDHYANGKLPDQATIKPGQKGLVQWAEPETGGEAYIPLAESKRGRSTSILGEVAQRFGFGLTKMADGGITDESPQKASIGPDGNVVFPDQAGKGKQSPVGRSGAVISFAQSRNGQPYGGNEDCSGFISELANTAVGLPPNAGRMSTNNEGTWLGALGFQQGSAPGSFQVGWVNDPNMPAGGHTAGTLPNNTNVESGGATGKVMYGGQAIGASNSLFSQHAFLPMDSAGGTGVPGNATTLGTQSVINPQAPAVGRASDAQLQERAGRATVDQANSERNAVYANPASTEQDKLAADTKLQSSQNALEKNQDTSAISLKGFLTKGAGILADGLLGAFGLENSVFSENNVYNKAGNALYNRFGPEASTGGGYAYQPQNLPSIVTTSTPQSAAGVTDPSLQGQIPSAGPISVDPNLGGATLTIPGSAAGAGTGTGAERWRPLATQMLAREGFSTGQVGFMLAQIQSESGGNPSIVQQVQDVNSGGNEAVGLLQVIPGTFATYRDPSLPNDRTNPSANMAAALRYYRARYGTDLSTQWGQGHGYDQGGIASGIGMMPKMTIRPERVLSPAQTETYDAMLPLLESINASQWSGNRFDSGQMVSATAPMTPRGGDGGYSPTINARVASINDLADLVERRGQMHAIGLGAAL